MATNKTPNQACLMIYWACSVDQDLLEELTQMKTFDEMRQYLHTHYGIPPGLIADECLKTLSTHKLAFAMFDGAMAKRCGDPICWDRSREDFAKAISQLWFTSP
jgi:hypothetical protein